jgi:hypothetical protein
MTYTEAAISEALRLGQVSKAWMCMGLARFNCAALVVWCCFLRSAAQLHWIISKKHCLHQLYTTTAGIAVTITPFVACCCILTINFLPVQCQRPAVQCQHPAVLSLTPQIVANVPRIATKPIETPRAPPVPSGCPFSASWCGESVLDPAVKGSTTTFNPDRWLDPKNKDSLKLHQNPFGYGTHSCLGWRIARAVAAAVSQELALVYDLTADTNTTFNDFPTGSRPANALPLSLKPLPAK